MSRPIPLSVTISSYLAQFIIGGSFTSWNIKPLYDINKKKSHINQWALRVLLCTFFFIFGCSRQDVFSLFPAFMLSLAASCNFTFTKHHQSSHQLSLFPKMHVLHNICILWPCYWINSQLKFVVPPNGERKTFCRRIERQSNLRQWFIFLKMLLWRENVCITIIWLHLTLTDVLLLKSEFQRWREMLYCNHVFQDNPRCLIFCWMWMFEGLSPQLDVEDRAMNPALSASTAW